MRPAGDDFFQVFCLTVERESEGSRLDHYLRDQDLGITRSQLKKLIDSGLAEVEGAAVRPAQKLRAGQKVLLRVPPPEPLEVVPEDIPLDILHEDGDVVVLNKQVGLVVHPAPGHATGTLVNALIFGRSNLGGDPLRPGIVHRLDKDTSGLMVVAKSDAAHAALAEQFHVHSVERRYQVLVAGSPPERGTWETLHGRHPTNRVLFSSKVTRGKVAISLFEALERFPGASRLAVTLRTGRTHQVRVHCHDHGFPVLGDPLYGPRHLPDAVAAACRALCGQALHAEILAFDHPRTGERMRFTSPPPEHFLAALDALRALLP